MATLFSPRTVPLALVAALGCNGSALAPLAQRMAGCPSGAFGVGRPAAGSYDYGACDAEGRLVLLGRLTLAIDGAGAVSGTWDIDWAPGADRSTEVGPQVGRGTLAGGLTGDQLWLDLNPGWADNNVGLSGTWRSNGGGGAWEFVAFTGPRASGTFTASR